MWIATEKFKQITTQNSYSGLHPDDYRLLKAGKKIKTAPKELIKGGYVKEAK